MSLITLMNIVRVRFYVFYHAKLQFDAGGRSLESLLNTRRTKRCLRMCANWMEKFHPFPLQRGGGGRGEYKRSIDAKDHRVLPRDHQSGFLQPDFHRIISTIFIFDTADRLENGRAKSSDFLAFARIRIRKYVCAFSRRFGRKRKNVFPRSNGFHRFGKLAGFYRALESESRNKIAA